MIKHILLLALATSILFSNNSLEVTLEDNTTKENPLHVNLTLTNISDHTVQFNEATFLSMKKEVTRDMFTVLEDGESIPYNGVLILNNPLYKSIEAGETYTTQIALSKFYKPKKGTHQYDVVYSDTIEVTEHNKTKLITLTSNHLEIERDIKKTKLKRSMKSSAKSARSTCSSNARSTLYADLYRARGYAQNATKLLQSGGYSHTLYKKWFGAGNSGRLNQVYVNFKNIYSASFRNVQFICQSNSNEKCSGSHAAYVHPSQPYNINVCPYYFRFGAPNRASTIVHELSHFSNVARTIDIDPRVYGNAETVARNHPNLAIQHAYSYGYYAKDAGSYTAGSNSGGSSSAVYYEFNTNKNTQGWSYRNMSQQYSGPYGGAWYFACNHSDPQLISPNLNLNAAGIKKVQITIANNNPSAYSWLQIFWKTNSEPYFSESKSKYVRISNHGGWSTYNINMQHSKWRGTIKQIRIDPVTNGNGSWIAIDHIRFLP